MTTSLARRNHPLRVVSQQRQQLAADQNIPDFDVRLADAGLSPLTRAPLQILQVNVGKMCNQTCKHCHVDAGPDRTEIMTRETMRACLAALARADLPTVDLTGGAPEMNPHFAWFVEQIRALGCHVIDRCNLTILTLRPYDWLVDFLATHRVEVVASLPYYLGERTDAQRGDGVFEKSIRGLRMLNEVGYGRPGSGLILNLVYNPVGAFLPPRQGTIEQDYKRELAKRHGIFFNQLFTITNMPINRYLEYLIDSGNYERYMQRLLDAFNPAAALNVMCRETLSVGWDGTLYDCDFNQMLELPVQPDLPRHIRDFDPAAFLGAAIATARHCYGCTAGAGSSCGGETLK